MTKCQKCGQEFDPLKSYYHTCPDCWAKQHSPYKSHHPRLKLLQSDDFLLWIQYIFLPAIILLIIGKLLNWW